MLDQSIATIKGIGEARLKAFEKLSIRTLHDLLYFMPRDYQDFTQLREVISLRHGELAALKLNVMRAPQQLRPRSGLTMVICPASDDTGTIQLVWYNQPYRARQIQTGERIYCGYVDTLRGLKLTNPAVYTTLPGIVTLYPLAQGLSQRHVREAVRYALETSLQEVREVLPESLRLQYGLCGIQEALRAVHIPQTFESLREARHRLAFEDMLYYLLAIALVKQERQKRAGIAFFTDGGKKKILSSLPYALTNAQLRVLDEIDADMRNTRPMNRLVQGDVGSGKTILAFYALQIAAQNGYQGVFLAPTEILAQQHYTLLKKQYGERVLLLCGNMKKKERQAAYAAISDGSVQIVVGTHALLQAGVQFHKLGVAVTDEQHRFGVRQRATIANKGETIPDVLVMSATPIPRTLAMLLYGDLELSVLDELPPGRQPVLTRIVPPEKRLDMYRFLEKQAEKGRQAYVVCPLIEHSDAMEAKSAQEVFEELCTLLPTLRIELLHGRMAAAKKGDAITRFREGKLDVLVSTTVVEVGVDVPNATSMVIENADRFGLAQLHQLRGRVGRGSAQSFCFLLSGSMGDTAKERLSIMNKTNDGFIIAQKDLELRGPGEFLGTRQHGEDVAQAARLAQNMDVLLEAQRAANELITQCEQKENAALFQEAKRQYAVGMREIANN